jgi:hypothetical protein
MKNICMGILVLLVGGTFGACENGFGCWSCFRSAPPFGHSFSTDSTAPRDILTGLTEEEERSAEEAGREFAARNALSDEQGIRAVRITRDFAQLQTRSAADLEDFARRLYGVNPSEVVAAFQESQMGNREKMNELVERAAAHFGTTPDNMKEVIRDLHGQALQENGIEF